MLAPAEVEAIAAQADGLTLRRPDGETLALREWTVEGASPRAVVQITHGLGEHMDRYDHVAQRLNSWGFDVRAHDHHGHGRSSGPRGGLPSTMRLIDDLAAVVDETRRVYPDTPLILLGHSMGGLVAASFVSREVRPVEALVMSSPAFDPGLDAMQKMLLAVLPRIAPNLRVGNGINVEHISHDPAVVQAYRDDPLNHDRICGRLASFLAEEGAVVQSVARRWRVPTLLLYAGADKIVRPSASKAFARASPQDGIVAATCFDGLFHEIFNEMNAKAVFATLRSWLDKHC
ncbi:alpha/beta hydrolase [Variovorax sp. dw_308]|uniref:alpha/beta hydrolase n=1 Tax=Variovorax sp. dw_308 TaxID=2721546 RepID=UPI001C486B19|nr:alpha/beta hydrolase [Variovorax sp. dw_308]